MIAYLTAVMACKCPRCREGNLFTHKNPYKFKYFLNMHTQCPVCNQPTEIEVGFYYGTGYVSYALAVAFLVISAILWKIIFHLNLQDNSAIHWFICSTILLLGLQPYVMRLSRSLWLSWFVKYDKQWKQHPINQPERVVPEQMNNW